MPDTLTFADLHAAVTGSAAAFRRRLRLQPAGGPGDKVFPPTYMGAVYAVENGAPFPRSEERGHTVPSIDWAYVERWAEELTVAELLSNVGRSEERP